MKYYRIIPRTDGASVDKLWLKENVERFPCGHYDVFGKFYSSITIDSDNFESRYIMGFIWNPLLVYFHKDFFEAIKSDLMNVENARVGELVDNKTGCVISDWKTYWIHPINIRGKKIGSYYKCSICHQKIYSLVPPQHGYLVEKEVAGKPLLFADIYLVIREDIYNKIIQLPNWKIMKKKIYFSQIKILKNPKDGYPYLLSEYEPEIRLVEPRPIN
jgi:hypothetical protein